MGRGKGALAAELVWWRATGPSSATKTSTDCYAARTHENQGTPSPSVALECKCAFGAKIDFELFFALAKCAPAAHICDFETGVCHANSSWMSLRVWPAREYRGPRSLAVGRGKALLAAELVWWGARGPSDVTKSFVDYYVTRTPQNQGTLGPS